MTSIKQALSTLQVGDTVTLPAYRSFMTAGSYRVPPPVYRYSKLFQYKIKTFNEQDGVIQIMRTE